MCVWQFEFHRWVDFGEGGASWQTIPNSSKILRNASQISCTSQPYIVPQSKRTLVHMRLLTIAYIIWGRKSVLNFEVCWRIYRRVSDILPERCPSWKWNEQKWNWALPDGPQSSADLPAKTEQIFAAFPNALTVALPLKPHNLQHSEQLEAQCVDLVWVQEFNAPDRVN